jgi:gliding motility-associated-like protein
MSENKKHIGFLVIGLLLLQSNFSAIAGHITGGEMFYEYNGRVGENHIYRVTLRLLMRCNSPRDFPPEIIIGVFDRKDHQRVRDVRTSLSLRNQISNPTNDPCISNPPELCFEVAEYTTDIALAGREHGYLLAAQIILRVAGIANVDGPSGNMGATYTAEIPGLSDGVNAVANHSARFGSNDLVIMCAENFFTYNFNALDGDNDSLRYRFCGAFQTQNFFSDINNAAPPDAPPYPLIPYAFNFSGSMPFGSRVSLNNQTGIASGVAPGSGIYLISVCVDEIRDGKVIATQRKDIQVNITGCNKAAALLEPEYNLCGESNTVFMVNLSRSPLIQTYEWNLFSQIGQRISSSTEARFSHVFADTGLYNVVLYTNKGRQCSDSTTSVVRYYPGFKADFSYTGQCFGGNTRFEDQTKFTYGGIASRFWVLDEPASSDNQSDRLNPVFRYETKGTRSVFLRVENTNGCRDSIFRPITIIDNPPVSLGFRDTLICMGDTLQLQANGVGAFLWADAAGIVSPRNQPTPLVAPDATTTYRVVQVEDNCRGEDSVLVRVTQGVMLRINRDTTICLGDTLLLQASGNGLRFDWQPAASVLNPNSNITIAKPTENLTIYRVRAEVGNCFASDSFRVNTVPYPIAHAGPDRTICNGDSTFLEENISAARFNWLYNGSVLTQGISGLYVAPQQNTTYILQVYDDLGCPKPGIDSLNVFVEPRVSISVTRDTSIVVNQPLQFRASGAQYYHWSPATNLDNTRIADPIAIFTMAQNLFTYTLIGFNDGGCADTAYIAVRVFGNGPTIYVPTAFTPNGDGLNETLKPTLAGMRQLNFFRVFNRYGEIVFQTTSPFDAWDGKYRGQQQPGGSFVWMVQAVDFDGNTVQQKGSTMLIR